MLIFKVIFGLSFVFATSAAPDFVKSIKLVQNDEVVVLFHRVVTVLTSFNQQAATGETDTLAQLLERINLMESNFQVKLSENF